MSLVCAILWAWAVAANPVANTYAFRVVVGSTRAHQAIIEVKNEQTLSYRLCKTVPVRDPATCQVIATEIPNTPEMREALEREFTAEFEAAVARATLANSPLGKGQRAVIWGLGGAALQGATSRIFDIATGSALVQEMVIAFFGYAGGSFVVDHFFSTQRRQDATIGSRVTEMTEDAPLVPGQSLRPGTRKSAGIRARRDMNMVYAALKRAIKRVHRRHGSPPNVRAY